MNLGEYDKAIVDLTEAIGINGRDGEFYLHRGLAFRQIGNLRNAIRDYDLASKAEKQDKQSLEVAKLRLGKKIMK